MFDLEKSISEWRNQMLAAGIKTPVPLEELEVHLREEVGRQTQSGINAQVAFEMAAARIGQGRTLKNEFRNANGEDKPPRIYRVLGTLWLALFSYAIASWLWRFIEHIDYAGLYFRVFGIPLFLFGAVASFFLARGTRWARIAVGKLAIVVAFIEIWIIWKLGWKWSFDDYLGVFAIVSATILLFPRSHSLLVGLRKEKYV